MGTEGFEPPRSLTLAGSSPRAPNPASPGLLVLCRASRFLPAIRSQNTMTNSAPNIEPDIAVSDFLKERKGEVSESSHRNYKYTLELVVQYCEENNIEYINELNGYILKKWKLWRQQHEINKTTLKNNLSTLRVFIKWCENAELLPPNLHEKITLPDLSDSDQTDDTMLSPERVEHTLAYLEKFEYATLRHAMFQFIWHTGARMGTIRSIDVDDYYPKRQYVEIRHRPETGTPLKNGEKAERQVNLNSDTCDVLDDYIEIQRKPLPEDTRRKALFTTGHGRISKTTIRKNMYAITRPCHVTNECPHGRNIDECEATRYPLASRCPSSMSPHPLRRASLTYHIEQDWPKDKLSERGNVSVSVLNKHYDESREEKNRMNRRGYLDNL